MKLLKNYGLFTYLVLFIIAAIFYKERTIFMDASFVVFSIIKDNSLAIQNFRFGSALTQIFPYLAFKLGLSLNQIILSYSVGFVLFFGSIYFVIKKVYKDENLSLALLLFNVLIVSGTFYWIQSEQIQGIALILLYYTSYIYNKKRNSNYLVTGNYFLLFAIVFIHPILIVSFLYIGIFILLTNDNVKQIFSKKDYFSQLGFFIAVYIIKILFFKHHYDSQAMGNAKNLITLFPHYFNLQSNFNFLNNLLKDYYLFGLIFLFEIAYYLKNARWAKLFLLVSFFFGYLLLINTSYPNGANKFYMESHYLQLSLIVIIPFVYDFLPKINSKSQILIIWVIILIRLTHIYLAHQPFTERLAWERSYLKNSNLVENNSKIISGLKNFHLDKLYDNWATPYEFWLLSTIEQKETKSFVFLENPHLLDWAAPRKDAFVTQWGVFDYKDLPQKYFIFKDTSSSYKVIDAE